jgi:hypothetical protein
VTSVLNRRRLTWPLLAFAPVVAALVALGGSAAVILGYGALLLVLDRAFPVAGDAMADAEVSFRRLARERRKAARRNGDAQRLVLLSEDSGWAALAERRRRGVQEIALDSIVGTVERDKAAAFDGRFRPPGWSRDRWARMWVAVQRGTALPPISVYRVGKQHFVRDGHHRVSVARALGVVAIEADVVELRSAPAREALAARIGQTAGDPPGPPLSARHPGELPAGHVQDLPVDVVRPWRAEEEDAARGLLRRGRPAEWDEHRRHLAHLLGNA